MADPQRARKLADRIRDVIATRLDRGMRDDRFGFVTITDVRVTGDLQHASVFYTVYGTDEERAATQEAFEAARGMLRSEVGRAVRVRLTPTLEFIPDAMPENASHIDGLLREARERDAETVRSASSASYAGDADPYLAPRAVLDETDSDGDPDDPDAPWRRADVSDDMEAGGPS